MLNNSDFEKAAEMTGQHELGFQNVRGDRGNWTSGTIGIGMLKGTKFGISAATYPKLDIQNLTWEAAKVIYHNDFWMAANVEDVPRMLKYAMFDACLNHGSGNARRMLQRAVGVLDDGKIGEITKRSIKAMEPQKLLIDFTTQRLSFMQQISTWPQFNKGWSTRVAISSLQSAFF